jgi:HlyD family secretion protein
MANEKSKTFVWVVICILLIGLGSAGWIRVLRLQDELEKKDLLLMVNQKGAGDDSTYSSRYSSSFVSSGGNDVNGISGSGNSSGSSSGSSDTSTDRAITVLTATVRKERIDNVLIFEGFIQPSRVVMVVPKVPGRVSDIKFDVGDSVRTGDILMQLDTAELEAQVAQAEAGVRMAEANLQRVLLGAREQELEQVRELVEQARTGLETAQSTHDRTKILYEKGIVSKHDYEMAKAQLDVVKSQYESAQQQLSLVESGAKEEEIEIVEAQVAQAEALLTLARTQLNDATIKAPADGVVASVNCEVGELVSNTIPVMVLIDLDTLNVPLSVGEKEVVQLKRGQSATIHIDVLPLLKIQGVVNNVSPTVDQTTRMFGVEVTFPNPDGVLKAGMYAKVEIVTGTYEEVLIVPEQAVTVDSIGRRVVYVVKDDIVRIQEVMLGKKQDAWVQVFGGLEYGDVVVIDNQVRLVPGASVIVRDGEVR